MGKLTCVVSCPISTYSGYGSRSRDFVQSLIQIYPEWDIKILPQKWGNTRDGFLDDYPNEEFTSRLITRLESQPDIWIQITIPSEFQPVGKYNIGVTAGIETDRPDLTWIEGCNRMSLVIVSSQHAKKVLKETVYEIKTAGNPKKYVKVDVPLEVIFEGIDPKVYRVLDGDTLKFPLDTIPEKEAILTVGHWLQGDLYHDRKNLALTVKTFLETFKNRPGPALILKTQGATSSILDRDRILKKIDEVKQTVRGKLPNVYVIHGDLSDEEINQLYNHPKVKAMVSLTKGEGFGRPLLEFSFVNKPIIASGWSGHLDFLDANLTTLLPGTLQPVHSSAVVDKMILKDGRWFEPQAAAIGTSLIDLFKNYKKHLVNAKKQGWKNRETFSLEQMANVMKKVIDEHMPPLAVKLTLDLPKIEKLQ